MRFAADENFDGTIFKKIRVIFPNLDIVRVQDTELFQAPDPAVLEWAAQEGRIVLTHDVQTLINDAYARVRNGLLMPGVVIVPRTLDIGQGLEDLELAIAAGKPEDFIDQVKYIPLR